MPKPIAYTATHAGQTFTRKSHRTYSHAVVVVPDAGRGEPGVWSWVGRPDLLPAQVSQAQRRFAGKGQVVAVPVTAA